MQSKVKSQKGENDESTFQNFLQYFELQQKYYLRYIYFFVFLLVFTVKECQISAKKARTARIIYSLVLYYVKRKTEEAFYELRKQIYLFFFK